MAFLAFACILFFVIYDPSPVIRRDYLMADVVSTMDTSSDKRMSTDAVIRLPDESLGRIRADGLAQAQWLLNPVCVAKLSRENGRVSYRLEPLKHCGK
jgi:hypothetical protein